MTGYEHDIVLVHFALFIRADFYRVQKRIYISFMILRRDLLSYRVA